MSVKKIALPAWLERGVVDLFPLDTTEKSEKNLAYVCVVDNFNLNLTPLGRFVMPPPMFEK